MTESTSSQYEKTSQDSISFPYTRSNVFSASKSGGLSSRIRFKPVRSDVLMRELLKEENSPKAENNISVNVSTTLHRKPKEKTYDSICNEDESTNILDKTLIEDDSIVNDNKDVMPGFAWLDKTPTNKPIETKRKVEDESPSNLFNKLSIKDNGSAKKDVKLEQKQQNDNVYQGLSEYLFKTPSFKNYKMSTAISNNQCSVSKIQYTTTNNDNSIISSSNPELLSAKKKTTSYRITPKRDSNMQFQICKNKHETPKQNSVHLQYSPRTSIPQNIRATNKADIILREKDMNIVTTQDEKSHKQEKPVTSVDTANIDKKTIPKIEPKHVEVSSTEKNTNGTCKSVVPLITEKNIQIVTENPKNKEISNEPKPPVTNPNQIVLYSTPNVPILESTSFKSLKIRGKDYIMINKLGEGGSGQVYRCLEQDTLQDRAVKVVNLAVDAHTAASYINEVKMLMDLQGNDRVIRMYDFEQQHQNLFVVMEKGDVDFSAFLRNITTEPQIQTHVIICYWIEMLKCVREIHKNGIIHSDLKPSNFLLVSGRLKLIDFGIASKVSGDMTSVIKNEQVGTFNYISPEALLDSRETPSEGKPRIRISYKSDVWSLGCILYQMVYRKTPFHNFNTWMSKVVTIIDRKHRIDYQAVEGVPPQLIETIKKCLNYDMKNRPSVEELLNIYYTGNFY